MLTSAHPRPSLPKRGPRRIRLGHPSPSLPATPKFSKGWRRSGRGEWQGRTFAHQEIVVGAIGTARGTRRRGPLVPPDRVGLTIAARVSYIVRLELCNASLARALEHRRNVDVIQGCQELLQMLGRRRPLCAVECVSHPAYHVHRGVCLRVGVLIWKTSRNSLHEVACRGDDLR